MTVTITGTNDVPVIGGVAHRRRDRGRRGRGGNLTTSGALTIADVDAGQSTFAPQAERAGSNGYGTFTLAADGTWTYTADNSPGRDPAARRRPDRSPTASPRVVSDGTASQVVTVTITAPTTCR